MKKCNDCNIEMVENAKINGQHPFELGIEGASDIFISFTNGKREVKNIFGKIKEKENYYEKELKARICPNCGKVELYVEIENKTNI